MVPGGIEARPKERPSSLYEHRSLGVYRRFLSRGYCKDEYASQLSGRLYIVPVLGFAFLQWQKFIEGEAVDLSTVVAPVIGGPRFVFCLPQWH